MTCEMGFQLSAGVAHYTCTDGAWDNAQLPVCTALCPAIQVPDAAVVYTPSRLTPRRHPGPTRLRRRTTSHCWPLRLHLPRRRILESCCRQRLQRFSSSLTKSRPSLQAFSAAVCPEVSVENSALSYAPTTKPVTEGTKVTIACNDGLRSQRRLSVHLHCQRRLGPSCQHRLRRRHNSSLLLPSLSKTLMFVQ